MDDYVNCLITNLQDELPPQVFECVRARIEQYIIDHN